MTNTAESLRTKSENLKVSIFKLVGMIRDTNDEIVAQIEENVTTSSQLTSNIEQLHADNEALAALKADNEAFISKVENILGN